MCSFFNFSFFTNIKILIESDRHEQVAVELIRTMNIKDIAEKEANIHVVVPVSFRHRLHGRGFQSKQFHDLETTSKTIRFQRVYTEPIQPLNTTVYVKAISFSGLCALSIGSKCLQAKFSQA